MVTKYVEYVSNNFYFKHSRNAPDSGSNVEVAPNSHPQYEIMLLISGTVYYNIDGEQFVLRPGDLMILNIYDYHSLTVDAQDGYERYVLQFPDDIIPNFNDFDLRFPFQTARSYHHIIPSSILNTTKIKNYLLECEALCKSNDKFIDAQLTAYTLSIMTEIYRTYEIMTSEKYTLEPLEAVTKKLSRTCIKYISDNIHKMITVKEMANALFISESSISHNFRREMGISLRDYIMLQKMQFAILYLNQGMPPQEVSENLGYANYSSFFRNFTKMVGHSPSKHINRKIILSQSFDIY